MKGLRILSSATPLWGLLCHLYQTVSMYNVNRNGPCTEPCGTPYIALEQSEVSLARKTNRYLSVSLVDSVNPFSLHPFSENSHRAMVDGWSMHYIRSMAGRCIISGRWLVDALNQVDGWLMRYIRSMAGRCVISGRWLVDALYQVDGWSKH
jgi:hypothetical protein